MFERLEVLGYDYEGWTTLGDVETVVDDDGRIRYINQSMLSILRRFKDDSLATDPASEKTQSTCGTWRHYSYYTYPSVSCMFWRSRCETYTWFWEIPPAIHVHSGSDLGSSLGRLSTRSRVGTCWCDTMRQVVRVERNAWDEECIVAAGRSSHGLRRWTWVTRGGATLVVDYGSGMCKHVFARMTLGSVAGGDGLVAKGHWECQNHVPTDVPAAQVVA